jgi:hypothetical protein
MKLIFQATALLLLSAAAAGDSKLDLTQRYLLLATTRTSTMQKELDQASAAGYRVQASAGGAEMVVLLEKAAGADQKYQYLLLATTRTSTMQKELNDAAAEGFRLMPRNIVAKRGALSSENDPAAYEIVLLMEKPPGPPQKYRYLLLATARTSTMQKELAQAVDEGYEIVGMLTRGEHMAILEKAER